MCEVNESAPFRVSTSSSALFVDEHEACELRAGRETSK